MNGTAKPILVIGGGIAGMTAALEAAEVGYPVVLVEKEPYLGGRVVRMHRYFPKMCPPTCGFEINTRRIRNNPRITVHTLATVEELTGKAGSFRARLKLRPRYVTGRCSLDDAQLAELSGERDDDFNLGMGRTKAVYLPHDMAWPNLHTVDREALTDGDVQLLTETLPEGAIDLEMTEREIEIDAGAVVLATGWRPYDPANLDHLGFGACPNVITNVMMERLAAKRGPTGGKILRPSDGKPAKKVAFVQCAGSRDEDHLAYCSAVCCMASLKQVRYLREQDEEAEATLFYIDLRAVGRFEKFYQEMLGDEKFIPVKGKVAVITQDEASGDVLLDVEDTIGGETLHGRFDLAVLATGMVPNASIDQPAFAPAMDEFGFLNGETRVEGVFAVGCSARPCDVSSATKDATAAALKAIQCLREEG